MHDPGMGRQLVRQLAGQGCSVAAGDWHKDTVADGAARAQAGAGPGVRVTCQADDVSGEAQVLWFGDEPVMVPIRRLASAVPAHTWISARAGRGRQHGRHRLLAAHPGYPTVFLVTAALILPAEFPHSVSHPGQCTRARVRGEGPVPTDREG
jgi:NAD(P)-dependent dehydrogenase (short-subunit alcohol dehydrogenase family)